MPQFVKHPGKPYYPIDTINLTLARMTHTPSKNLVKEYSLNTILVFPQCQSNGYGLLMISFSYLFLKEEGVVGTP